MNLRQVHQYPPISSKSLEKKKNKRFSADGQNIAKDCTIMKVMTKTDVPAKPPLTCDFTAVSSSLNVAKLTCRPKELSHERPCVGW